MAKTVIAKRAAGKKLTIGYGLIRLPFFGMTMQIITTDLALDDIRRHVGTSHAPVLASYQKRIVPLLVPSLREIKIVLAQLDVLKEGFTTTGLDIKLLWRELVSAIAKKRNKLFQQRGRKHGRNDCDR